MSFEETFARIARAEAAARQLAADEAQYGADNLRFAITTADRQEWMCVSGRVCIFTTRDDANTYIETHFGQRPYPDSRFDIGWLPVSDVPANAIYPPTTVQTKGFFHA